VECAARSQGAAGQGCPFYVSAGWSMKKECVIASTVKGAHSCQGAVQPRGVSQSRRWLLRILPETTTIREDTKPADIIEAALWKWKSHVSYQTARRVKCQILGRSQAARASQYQLLPHYIQRLRESTPNATRTTAVNPQTQRFERIFTCPPHQCFGFPTPPRLGRSWRGHP